MIIITVLSLVACNNQKQDQAQFAEDSQLELEDKQVESGPELYEITLAAIGDILIHDRVYDDARTDQGFDFMPMIERVAPYLTAADVVTANQETMIGGEEYGLSGYPSFNSPKEVGDMLKEVGVDLVNLANNHTLDRGEEVVYSALDYWDELGVEYVGSYRSFSDRDRIRTVEKNNIGLAFLGYSYGTNGIPIPDGKEYLINLIDREQISHDVQLAKQHADVVVMHLHFGDEYVRMPNEQQKELAQFVADLGVDVILGHHPHVLQPIEWLEREDGQETLVIYSLGNFLSGQDQLYRQIGGILELTIKKEVDQEGSTTEITSPRFLPTYVTFAENPPHQFRMIPMHELTDQQLEAARYHYEEIKEHMSQWLPELDFIN